MADGFVGLVSTRSLDPRENLLPAVYRDFETQPTVVPVYGTPSYIDGYEGKSLRMAGDGTNNISVYIVHDDDVDNMTFPSGGNALGVSYLVSVMARGSVAGKSIYVKLYHWGTLLGQSTVSALGTNIWKRHLLKVTLTEATSGTNTFRLLVLTSTSMGVTEYLDLDNLSVQLCPVDPVSDIIFYKDTVDNVIKVDRATRFRHNTGDAPFSSIVHDVGSGLSKDGALIDLKLGAAKKFTIGSQDIIDASGNLALEATKTIKVGTTEIVTTGGVIGATRVVQGSIAANAVRHQDMKFNTESVLNFMPRRYSDFEGDPVLDIITGAPAIDDTFPFQGKRCLFLPYDPTTSSVGLYDKVVDEFNIKNLVPGYYIFSAWICCDVEDTLLTVTLVGESFGTIDSVGIDTYKSLIWTRLYGVLDATGIGAENCCIKLDATTAGADIFIDNIMLELSLNGCLLPSPTYVPGETSIGTHNDDLVDRGIVHDIGSGVLKDLDDTVTLINGTYFSAGRPTALRLSSVDVAGTVLLYDSGSGVTKDNATQDLKLAAGKKFTIGTKDIIDALGNLSITGSFALPAGKTIALGTQTLIDASGSFAIPVGQTIKVGSTEIVNSSGLIAATRVNDDSIVAAGLTNAAIATAAAIAYSKLSGVQKRRTLYSSFTEALFGSGDEAIEKLAWINNTTTYLKKIFLTFEKESENDAWVHFTATLYNGLAGKITSAYIKMTEGSHSATGTVKEVTVEFPGEVVTDTVDISIEASGIESGKAITLEVFLKTNSTNDTAYMKRIRLELGAKGS
jgi:hypothetical protein